MVLRKVDTLTEIPDDVQYVIRDTTDDEKYIIEITPAPPAADQEMDAVKEGEKEPAKDPAPVLTDVATIGKEATWADVSNPVYFDLEIEDKTYSWDGKPGTQKIGVAPDGNVVPVVHPPIAIQYSNGRTVHAYRHHFVTEAPLPVQVNGGRLVANARVSPAFDVAKVKLHRDGQFVKQYPAVILPEPVAREDLLEDQPVEELK